MKWEAKVVGQIKIDPNEYVSLHHARVRDADYSGRKLSMFGSVGSHFENCRFENTQIEDAQFGSGREMSEYVECSFDGMKFWHGSGFARFVRCSFRNINVRKWFCFGTEMIDCVFTGRLKSCIFNGTPMEDDQPFLGRKQNEFHGNDFSGADLLEVSFRTGIDLSKQRLPSGPQYVFLPDASAELERARRAVLDWEDQDMRRESLLTIQVLEETVSAGQRQLLLRADDWHRCAKGSDEHVAIDKLFALLRGNSNA